MERKRIVITGVGVVAPNGIGKEEFWNNCFAGVSGIKPITLFDTSKYRCHLAGEISNFQPEKYLGLKGLRNLDRTTLLSLVAAKLAIEDAHLEITEKNTHDMGVVLGSTMGSVHSISSFDLTSLREGPRYVNPALFPNTVINSPASQVAIRFGIKGLCSTIGTGFTASLDALEYSTDMLQLGRVNTVLVGGVEELCIETFTAFSSLGLLISSNQDISTAPDHLRRKRVFLGEGAGMLVLETEESAIARSAPIYGEVLAVNGSFDVDSAAKYQVSGGHAESVVRKTLELGGIHPTDVDTLCVWSAAEVTSPIADKEEIFALQQVFGNYLKDLFKLSVKSLVGECFSAMGALQLAAGIGTTLNKHNATVLITTYSQIGTYTAAIVKGGNVVASPRFIEGAQQESSWLSLHP